mgnify:CR=1 FL=1
MQNKQKHKQVCGKLHNKDGGWKNKWSKLRSFDKKTDRGGVEIGYIIQLSKILETTKKKEKGNE